MYAVKYNLRIKNGCIDIVRAMAYSQQSPNSWVLVAITLQGCGHCTTIHENWNNLFVPTLGRTFPGLVMYNMHFNDNAEPINTAKWPGDLEGYIVKSGFPTILLIPRWEWEQAIPLDGRARGYRFTQVRMYKDPDFRANPQIRANNLSQWIQSVTGVQQGISPYQALPQQMQMNPTGIEGMGGSPVVSTPIATYPPKYGVYPSFPLLR